MTTLEKIRQEIKSLKIHGMDDVSITNNFLIDKVLQILDKYAEQDTCKHNCEECEHNDGTGTQQEVCKFLVNLMEVLEKQMQEPKIGHWIYDDEYSNWFDVTYVCSCCKRAIIVPYEARNKVYKDYPYCHCGAKMIEPQERSDKE